MLRRTWRSTRTRFGPWLLWLGTMAAVYFLYTDVSDRGRILGFAYGIEYKVAAPSQGRIQSVAVEIGQTVKRGDVIAVLDGSSIEAEIRETEALKRKARAEIEATGEEVRQRSARTTRTLDVSIEETEIALKQAEAENRARRIEFQVVTKQLKRQKQLIHEKLAPARNLTDLEIQQAALKSQLATSETTLNLLRKQLAAARARRVAGPVDPVEVAVAPLREEIRVLETRLSHLRHRKSNLVLRAPADGQVYRIIQRTGDVAAAGQTIVRLIGTQSDRIVACVSEYEALNVQLGAPATLNRRDVSGQSLKGRVISMGPIVDEVPVRCRRDPRLPAWGRDVVIALDEPGQLLPGQAFYVSIGKDPVPPGSAVAASPKLKSLPSDVREMRVPKKLASVSRLEPSGLLWIERLNRYVVVSDDTGLPDSNKHAPWLFALDGDGGLDAQPIVVRGLDEVNDLEAIAGDQRGTTYVISSQSYNRKGKRKRRRQVFTRLVLENETFRTDGLIHLAEALEGASQEFRAKLGISDMRSLDIEGLTMRNGSLLIGLKAPLDAQGRAMIWKMDFPDRLFEGHSIEASGLSLWTTVRLQVKADGAQVPGGISELLALPDGGLLIGATASGMEAQQQDGALFFAREMKAGVSQVRFIRSFEGLKPEGLALVPNTGHFIVVFDRGNETPSWITLPWPNQ